MDALDQFLGRTTDMMGRTVDDHEVTRLTDELLLCDASAGPLLIDVQMFPGQYLTIAKIDGSPSFVCLIAVGDSRFIGADVDGPYLTLETPSEAVAFYCTANGGINVLAHDGRDDSEVAENEKEGRP